eukprot:CAMPEP_0177773726 /NCGR_PEP_ID=MMETSP0491_2-20121128/13038_1 /TAXON_ID=63592 /ORGANISM="Tetraselmis chuii, Strain PLY429" /LENGTH=767 /DNA_ID=CAMNT_0019291879 /DNA_START=91 /DNA_END=2394 /DNA_ORIENTATION=+
MDKYRLHGIIGQGQYGTAHKVESLADHKLYCMKRIPMSKKDDADGAMREAHLLSTLNHPNVLGYHESFLHDGSLCIVTHFCEEGDLFTLIRNRAKKKHYFSEEEIVDMFLQVAMGLHHIHTKRVLHRDLKTQNIFVARGGILKLGDFGISKVLEKTDEFATTVTGTPYYMAPEICKNEPYSLKSDIWSLGCVLYELCTLKHAFAADSLLSLVYQIVKGNFPPIPQDQFSSDLSNLVQMLLAKDSQMRPTLQDVFDLPFVEQHKQRFMRSQRRLNAAGKDNGGKAKHRIADAQHYMGGAPVTNPSVHGLQEQERALTPREKLRLRKQQQADQRAMELKVANINMNPHRELTQQEIKDRKSQMIRGSTFGSAPRPSSARSQRPGSSSGQPAYGSGAYGDSTVLMGSVAQGAGETGAYGVGPGGFSGGPGGYSGYDNVNMGTVNLAGTERSQYATGPFDPTGASVLMGSVVDGREESGRPGSGGSNFQYGIDMRAPSTPLHFPSSPGNHDSRPAVSNQELTARKTSRLVGDSAAGTPAPPSRPSSSASHIGPVEVGGFRFGVEPPAPATPSHAPEPAVRSPQQPAATALPPSPAQVRVPPKASLRRHEFSSEDDSDEIDDEVDDSADEYSDDFEDYSDDFEEDESESEHAQRRQIGTPGTPQVQSEREAMMRNLRRMNASQEDTPPGSTLEETVSSKVRNTKLDQLRARCQAALGRDYQEVYQYLRHARESFGYGDDEKLKMKLIEMVGRRKLAACFECDQLVFQELLQQ